MEKINDILKPYLRLYDELDEEAGKHLLWSYPYDKLAGEYGYIYLGNDKNSESYLKATSVKNSVFDILKEDSTKLRIYIPLLCFIGVGQDFFQEQSIANEMRKLSIEILEGFGIELNIPKELPEYDHEVKMSSKYRSAKDSYRFNEIYDYIEACERGALERQLLKMTVLKLYIQFLYNKDQEKLVELVGKKEDCFGLRIFNHWLEREQMIKIALKCSNFRYIFDVLRCCFYMKSIDLNEMAEQELTQYKQLMIKMSSNNEVWKQMIFYFFRFPSRAPGICYILGDIVESLPEENVKDIIQYIKIEKKNPNVRGKEWELLFFSHVQFPVSERWKKVLEKIFEKWLNYIENTEMAYKVIETNIDVGVKKYINYIMSDGEKEKLLAKYRINLDENDNVWFGSMSEHQTSYFRLLTIVRCLSGMHGDEI